MKDVALCASVAEELVALARDRGDELRKLDAVEAAVSVRVVQRKGVPQRLLLQDQRLPRPSQRDVQHRIEEETLDAPPAAGCRLELVRHLPKLLGGTRRDLEPVPPERVKAAHVPGRQPSVHKRWSTQVVVRKWW